MLRCLTLPCPAFDGEAGKGMQSEKSNSISGVNIGTGVGNRVGQGPHRVGTGHWEKRLKGPLLFSSQDVNKIKTYHLSFSTDGSRLLHT